jgi:hypothetical protein
MHVTPLVPPLRIWQRQKETLLRGIYRDQKKRHTSTYQQHQLVFRIRAFRIRAESVSRRYESRYGSFHHQAKIVTKTFIRRSLTKEQEPDPEPLGRGTDLFPPFIFHTSSLPGLSSSSFPFLCFSFIFFPFIYLPLIPNIHLLFFSLKLQTLSVPLFQRCGTGTGTGPITFQK